MAAITSSRALPRGVMTTVRKSIAIFKRDASLALSYDVSFWMGWIGIGFQVLTFFFISQLIGTSAKYGFGGQPAHYFDFVVVNLAFIRFQTTAIQCFQTAVRDDQLAGTLEAIMVTPTSLPVMILSRGLWAFALTLAQVVLVIAVALLLGLNLTHINVLSVMVFTLLTIACMSPLGVLSAASIMTFKQSGSAGIIMGNLTQLLGGVFFPIATLPLSLQYLAWLLPITHALNGIRGAVHGASIAQLAPDALWLLLVAALLLPISLWSFSKAVDRAKVDGTLGQY